MLSKLDEIIRESARIKTEFIKDGNMIPLMGIARALSACLKSGKKILVCGNGGSASDSLHFAAEIVGRFMKERKALPAVSLNSDVSTMTSISNDYGYDQVFRRQAEGLAQQGDILLCLSTSGNSKNIIEAVKWAKKNGVRSMGLLGRDGGELKSLLDLSVTVSCDSTPRIQEVHITLIHAICSSIENELFPTL